MSEDGEIDVESDGVPDGFEDGPLDKRAHHNALERKRRDHIKDSFHNLRDCIPSLSGEKVSRAHILNKATEYIRQMQKGSAQRLGEIDELRKKNELLEEQMQVLDQMQAVDNGESMEDLLQAVAEKVQQRQALRQQQAQAVKPVMKLDQDAHRVDQIKSNAGTATTANISPIAVGKDGKLAATASINQTILATQTLLNALKNPQTSKMAARVLASPLRPQTSVSGGPSPRGIVTATTVPGWGSPGSQQQQQPMRAQPASVQVAVQPSTDNPLSVLAGTAANASSINNTDSSEERATQTSVTKGGGSGEGGGGGEKEDSLEGDMPPNKKAKTDGL